MLPWHLFGLTPRDSSGTLIRVWNQYARTAVAGIQYDVSWRVPSDQAAMLLHFSAAANATPGSLPRDAALIVENQANETIWGTYASFPGSLGNQTLAAGTIGSLFIPLNGVLVPPNQLIRAIVGFTAPIGLSTAIVSLAAVLIPRGDIGWL